MKLLQEFEKNGCLYRIDSRLEQVEEISGHWCSKYEYDKKYQDHIFTAKIFLTLFAFPKTRQNIIDCFKYGTGFVYVKERLARREKLHAKQKSKKTSEVKI